MKIMESMKKVPGGMMVVPLVLGAIVNTVAPNAIKIGGFTTALFSHQATLPLCALFILCAGSQIDIKNAGEPFKKGAVLTLAKFLVGAIIGLIVGKVFGNAGVLGLTPLAIIPALTNSNGSLYVALASEMGDNSDVGAVSILSINDGPFFTMVAMGIAGIANIPFIDFVAVLVPIIVGFILGNIDPDWREYLKHGKMLIPFLGFSIGANLNFGMIIKAGLPGIVLGLVTVLFTGLAGYYSYILFGGKKAVGAAIGTTAGVATATPAAIAAADPSLAQFVGSATVQVSASVIITAILCPLFVSYLYKRDKRRKEYLNEKSKAV